ncbi:MAG: hypothetical protein V4594_12075 [Bacteroidota bacterium]
MITLIFGLVGHLIQGNDLQIFIVPGDLSKEGGLALQPMPVHPLAALRLRHSFTRMLRSAKACACLCVFPTQ